MADHNEYLDGILNNITDLDRKQDQGSLQKSGEKKTEGQKKSSRNRSDLERELFAAENDLLELNDMLDKADRNVVVDDGLKHMMDHYSEITGKEAPPVQVGPSAEETDLRDKEEKALDDLISVLEGGRSKRSHREPLSGDDSAGRFPSSGENVLEEQGSPVPEKEILPVPEEEAPPVEEEPLIEEQVAPTPEESPIEEQEIPSPEEPILEEPESPVPEEQVAPIPEEPPIEEQVAPTPEEPPIEEQEILTAEESLPGEPVSPVPEEVAIGEQEAPESDGQQEEEDALQTIDSVPDMEEITDTQKALQDLNIDALLEKAEAQMQGEKEGEEREETGSSSVPSPLEEEDVPLASEEIPPEETSSQAEEISLNSFLESSEGEEVEVEAGRTETLAPEELKDSISAQIAAVLSGEDVQASLPKERQGEEKKQKDPIAAQETSGAEKDQSELGQEKRVEDKTSIPDDIKEKEVDLKDLDKIMDSLATDNIDDIENEKGQASKEDIEALQAAMMNELGDREPEEETSPRHKRKKRKERKGAENKMGFFARVKALFSSLSDDEEEEETEDPPLAKEVKNKDNKKEREEGSSLGQVSEESKKEEAPVKEEDQLASLTEENAQVLKELNEEDAQAAEKKKKKKKKPKKEKKPKKAPKPKKPKKVPEPPQGPPPKRIPPKQIILVGIFACTFGILVYLPSEIFPVPLVVKQAKSSYKKGEYWNTYKDLYGKTALLTKEQQEEFKKAEAISKMQRYYDAYADYSSVVGKEPEALNALIKGVGRYDEIRQEAKATGDQKAEEEVNNTYDNIVAALQDDYHLTDDLAKQLYAVEDPIEYTIRLQWITGVRGGEE